MPRPRRHTHTRATLTALGLTARALTAVALTTVASVGCSSGGGGDASGSTTALGHEVAASNGGGRSATPADTDVVSELYVVQGTTGATTRDGDGWAITLAVPDGDVLAFDDRPHRGAHHVTVAELADSWDRLGFADDPPNAALAGTASDGTPIDVAVELAHPRWDAATHTLAVTARTIGADATTDLPPSLTEASLFIDDAQQAITVNLINLASDPLVVSSITSPPSGWSGPQAPQVGWDFGPTSSNGPTLDLSLSNPQPGSPSDASILLEDAQGDQWKFTLAWDGDGNPSVQATHPVGGATNMVGQPTGTPGPFALQDMMPGDGSTATYQAVFVQS